MNLTVSKTNLQKALSVVQSIVDRKSNRPVLANFLISASEGKFFISATDLEITALAQVEADVIRSGTTTVNAKILSDIVRELPDGNVAIALTEGERIEIVAKSSKLKMVGVRADEYPALEGLEIKVANHCPAAQLLEMINKTIYSVSTDETRFSINGVCFEIIEELKGERLLRMVATDGHRLAIATRPAGDLNFPEPVIVPRKGLNELRKLLDEEAARSVGLEIKDGFLVYESVGAKVSMRLIDGDFPDYKQVIPNSIAATAIVSTSEFSQALRRVALMVNDKAKCVSLSFVPDSLKISSSSAELGEAVENLEIAYSGEPVEIGFNVRYLLDITTAFADEGRTKIEMSGELGACKFYSENDESCIAVVMPMRLD